ncbi:nuclear transport factor 2 family protein [Streptomyces canus]|uniref:nuclear transport factor 2 family protein n=1 Tax=Streptomyces canus TaxID=58343 RepID=UPI003402115E
MSDNKTTVLTAVKELFGDNDVTAVDRWVAADYRQHSSAAPDGPEGLRGLIGSLTDDVRHEVARVIAEGDLVAVHGVYYGFGPDPLVAFDLFRVADGKLAEHWDALTPQVTKTVSGRSQVDGPAEVSDLDKTEANRALVSGSSRRSSRVVTSPC